MGGRQNVHHALLFMEVHGQFFLEAYAGVQESAKAGYEVLKNVSTVSLHFSGLLAGIV